MIESVADIPLDTLIVAAALAERLTSSFPDVAQQIPGFANAARSAIARVENLADAVAIAAAPLEVRGFGHVRDRAARALLARLRSRNG